MSTNDFSTISAIYVCYVPHPKYPLFKDTLNYTYSGYLTQYEEIFTDANKVAVKPDVLSIIRRLVCEDLIIPGAIHTTDTSIIPPLFQNCIIRLGHQHGTQTGLNVRSAQDVTNVFNTAVSANDTVIHCHIGLTHLFLSDPDSTLLDWTEAATTQFPQQAIQRPPTATDVGAAVASAVAAAMLNNIPSAADVGTAVATAIATGRGTGVRTSTSGAGTGTSTAIFNSNGLPDSGPNDVKARYDRKQSNQPVMYSHVFQPITDNGFRYYLDGTDRLILADGTLFILQERDEKGVVKDPVRCHDDSKAGIRTWYVNFAQHLHDHGYFAMPLWLFRAGHGQAMGFTMGSGLDDDLPARMAVPIEKSKQTIFRILSKSDMFPKDSRIPSIVESCYGNGYVALKQIIFTAHPAFHPQPSILVRSYPKQLPGMSLLTYFNRYKDFIQLRAYIQDIDASLDDPDEVNIFIQGAQYATYLNRVTREERKQTTMQYKYEESNLVETLQALLLEPDSPAMLESLSRARVTERPKTYPVQQQRRVHSLDVSHEDSLESLCNELDFLPDAPDSQARELKHIYSACVYRIKTDPTNAAITNCIVCNAEHRFDACPVLANTEFLRSHYYIRFCQQLRREASSRQAAFKGPEEGLFALPPSTTKVNAINTASTPQPMSIAPVETADYQSNHLKDFYSIPEDDDNDQDFQEGRR
jgi:hypothetical protein